MIGRKLSINEMRDLAQSKGGECLSEKYIDAETKLLWKCGHGHEFEATPHYIKKGHWCSKCVWENKFKELKEIAKKKGGKCLTDEYISSITKMRWECEFGHEFEASPYEIKKGAWCSKCKQLEISKIKIEESKKLASRKGGKCLAEEYINNRTKIKWECSEGHIWEASYDVIKRGHWCPVCAKNRTLTIEDMQEIARQRGGKCLSKEYNNLNTKLLWECEFGHTWEATPGNIKGRKSWCPYCSNKFSSEEICRYVFENLFNKKFPKIRPRWLVNGQGNRLELDGYCSKLKLAFEHQGGQHYKKIDFFERHMTLERKQINDDLKKKICDERGINIIYVEQLGEKIQIEELKEHIIDQCRILGLDEYVQKIYDVKIDYSKAYSSYSKQMLDKLKEIAISRGGECLSDRYINNNTPMKWKCSKGHIWESAPVNIKNMGHWCPTCSGNQRISMEEIKQLAIERGGKCLSENYKNKDTKLIWQCSEGHTWEANLRNVRGNGTWCPICAGKIQYTIEDMQKIAQDRGGKCLSDKYIDSKTNLLWECSCGYQWKATPSSIKRGSWCPSCSKNIKLTIEEMRNIAQERGGECLSEKYTNNKTKLLWKCSEGHTWKATPNAVKRGTWCPFCSGNRK